MTHGLLGLAAGVLLAAAQSAQAGPPSAAPQRLLHESVATRNWVVPQARSFATLPGASELRIQQVEVRIELLEQVARTTLDVTLENPWEHALEGQVLLPVPRGASVVHFDFEGSAGQPTARLLPEDEARATYEGIVARLRDPALLEFASQSLVRSSVFPVPARGTQRVRLVLEQLLELRGQRVDYVLPRSESLGYAVPWSIEVEVSSKTPIAAIYSPSHEFRTLERAARSARLELAGQEVAPGPLRLSVLYEAGLLTASMLATPDPDGPGGWFLLLAGLAPEARQADRMPREVTIVLDRSGSMGGVKFDQARAAALQVFEGLGDDESFQLIDYADDVTTFAAEGLLRGSVTPGPVRSYLGGLRAKGSTNLDGALQQALGSEPTPGMLPVVLFLTDGLPTAGATVAEGEIRRRAKQANVHGRRVFTFGVGLDVNAPLLDGIANDSRATSSYVLPDEDIERSVAAVFEGLLGPVVVDLELEVRDAQGQLSTRALRDVYPQPLPDLFEGDRLVLIGRYSSPEKVEITLRGRQGDAPLAFRIGCDLGRSAQRNDFIPRLWAGRRIAALIDVVRQAGADPETLRTAAQDPELREVTDEILALSMRHGVLTEYTSFLALEGTSLTDGAALSLANNGNFVRRAVETRAGSAGVNQGRNWNAMRSQEVLNYQNSYWAADNSRSSIGAGLQQVADRAFFRRGERWIDGRLVELTSDGEAFEPARTVELGSAQYLELSRRLVAQGRGGLLALPGEVLVRDGEQLLLIRNTRAAETESAAQGSEPGRAAEPAEFPETTFKTTVGSPSGRLRSSAW